MISVPVIAFFIPPTKAIMLLCFPILCSNFLQMKVHKGIGSYRFAPMLFTLIIGLIIGGRLILEIELSTVSIIIAISIIAAAVVNLFGLNFRNIDIKYEKKFYTNFRFFFRYSRWAFYILWTSNFSIFNFYRIRKKNIL